jgi:hypothetical protein
MTDDETMYRSGHRAPKTELVGEQAGHRAPEGEGAIIGSGHPAPSRLDLVNVAPSNPPPKRDDAGSSGKPPAK